MYGMSDAYGECEEELAAFKTLVSFAKEEILLKVASSDLPVDERVKLIALLNGVAEKV